MEIATHLNDLLFRLSVNRVYLDKKRIKMKFCINGGKLKHLALKHNIHSHTRPSKAILRQSLFNTIGSNIIDCVFVEGFAGCGTIGIEALSRGASYGIFYEINAISYNILTTNLSVALKRDSTLKYEAHNADFFTQKLNISQHFILYLDPPFCKREGMADIYERCFKYIENLGTKWVYLIVFEHYSGYNMPDIISAFTKHKTRVFGKSALSYYIPKE